MLTWNGRANCEVKKQQCVLGNRYNSKLDIKGKLKNVSVKEYEDTLVKK